MSDLIDRQRAIETICLAICEEVEPCDCQCKEINLLQKLPSAEKRGRWIKTPEDDYVVSGICSECGWEAEYYADDVAGMPYCPNCGARMEESEKDA